MSQPTDALDLQPLRRVDVGGVLVDPVTEQEVVDHVDGAWFGGRGGTIVTPNIDIWRMARADPSCAARISGASLVVADGQPLVWASHLAGTPLPGRVTGSGLIESLCALAAQRGRGVFVLGGGTPDTAQRAAGALVDRYPGLRISGHLVPPFGFESSAQSYGEIIDQIVASQADLVLVGLGFPKQEHLSAKLSSLMPGAWFLGCGGGVAMAAGMQRRSPRWAQNLGVEWMVRLAQEPKRLARRYLIDDIPAALQLLGRAAAGRARSSS